MIFTLLYTLAALLSTYSQFQLSDLVVVVLIDKVCLDSKECLPSAAVAFICRDRE
jgi:hypothetical protein